MPNQKMKKQLIRLTMKETGLSKFQAERALEELIAYGLLSVKSDRMMLKAV